MATAELESVAEFKRRASALGVTEDHLKALVTAGFDTFGKYAVAVPYVPGAADEKPLVELLKKTFGANPKNSELACLRRLFWESHALALGLEAEAGAWVGEHNEKVAHVREGGTRPRAEEAP